MLLKHHSIQRDQLEMITLDQLVPANDLVRKMEATNGNSFRQINLIKEENQRD